MTTEPTQPKKKRAPKTLPKVLDRAERRNTKWHK